ncbi:MAG: ABC transporter permease, partial [Candidatus Solibacter usitatus]|nr:ABC transporter permease [Candidatus Solibacter usitatus]
QLAERGSHYLTVVARPKGGVSLERARAEMSTIAARLEKQYPATNTKVGAVVVPVREQMTGDTRLGLLVLLAAAGCVLLIACANVANLLLARGAARRRELAVRAALGAGGGRLIRQMITESLLLAGLGGAAGVGLAAAGRVLLEKIVPPGFAGDAQLALDGRLLLFALGVSLATGLFFSVAPAATASRWPVVEALKQGGRGGLGTGGRFRKGLAVAEVALSALLLVSAGLLVQTLLRLRGLDLGFQPEKLLTMLVSLPNPKYADPARREAFELAVLGNVRSLPGVRGAAFTTNLPFTSIGNTVGFAIEGQPAAGPGDNRDVMARAGSTDYLPVLGVTLREGRFFTADDRAGSRQVVIVNEFLAKRFWPGQSALGKRLKADGTGPEDPWRTIVGVVADLNERGFELPQKYAVYAPLSQWRDWRGSFLAVRTEAEPAGLSSAVREVIWSVDRDQPVALIRTMDSILDQALENRRLQMQLIGAFAALALALASVGLYCVLSYGVAQRTQEIGVRIALGASPAGVARLIAGQGARLAALGTALG